MKANVLYSTLIGSVASNLAYSVGSVIVDEAGQATEPEALVSLNRATSKSFLVLVGDHMQLPPHCESQRARDGGLGVSLFERLIMQLGIKRVTLRVQHREAPSISFWPNTFSMTP